MTENWVVVVTYGTRPNQIFVTVPDKGTAEIWEKIAKERHYHDARIEKEKDYLKKRKEQSASNQRKADPRPPYSKAR